MGNASGSQAAQAFQHEHPDFGALLVKELPALRARARFLEHCEAAADDLVHDTVERALTKSDRFRPGTDLRRWLLVILQNLFTDRWRERARFRGPVADLESVPEAAPSENEHPSRSEVATVDEVRRVLESIDEPLRLAFELRFFEQLSYQQVAMRMGVPVGTVGTRILRARSRLNHAFAVDHGETPRPARPTRSAPAMVRYAA